MLKRWVPVILLILFSLSLAPVGAQDVAQRVELEASDGLVLVGTYYAPSEPADEGAAAVLLMHHGGSQKEAWIDFIPVLLEAGYATLAVDLRGHGETGGSIDLPMAEEDAHLWLEWLRAQPGINPDQVHIVGASMGGDIGLNVMADDEQLASIVSISPALDLDGYTTQEAVEAIGTRPMFFVAGQGAEAEAEAARTLFQVAEGDVLLRLYDNSACCTFLFMFEADLAPSIIAWLNQHN